MTKITKEEVLKLAKMSNIHVDEQEAESYIKELESVLSYASGLAEIAKGNEHYVMPCNYDITREDKTVLFNTEILIESAPKHETDYFVVPVIIKHD